ncbi:unnamed protein product [Dovyalis caffra]|uniref:Uncharacterized protein n=1 Tax=Dovyalis caffra TaxID=77055 RepID=A0AAV1QQE3_9ROSI|nr:unnamed protein product [Dovyalis caffra]
MLEPWMEEKEEEEGCGNRIEVRGAEEHRFRHSGGGGWMSLRRLAPSSAEARSECVESLETEEEEK